jgi:Tol biopolymer transport system component/DNA-binding winged helix-turn-helix (wHTH) protein
MASPPSYRFEDITVDVAAMRICRGGEELALEPKSFRLLQFLIEHRDRVVSKEEIFRVVWEDRAVSDNALTRAIAQIRKVLDDDPRKPRCIDTVPTVGYRFIGMLDDSVKVQSTSRRGPAHSWRRGAFWLAVGATGLAVAGGLALWHRKPEAAVSPTSAPVPLTTYVGSERAPSFSPGGDQIAFEWNGEKQNNFDIYVKTLGSDATPLRLTTDPAPDRDPAWSPDGRTIAFERFVSGDRADLILIPALGGPERKLGEFRLWVDRSGFSPEWSNDSKWLVVPIASGSGATLFRVSAETGEVTPLLEAQDSLGDVHPALSPDGTTLVFLRHPSFNWGDLWSVRVDDNMKAIDLPHQIRLGAKLLWMARWTPDGADLIANVPSGAIRMSAAGNDNPQPLLALGSFPYSFAISRRGNRLAFSQIHGDANIYRIDLTARVLHSEPLIVSTVRDVYPKYSPDGRKIAFHSNRSGQDSEVWVVDADGKNARQLTFLRPGVTGTPHWSPDGQTIAFDSNVTGTFQVYTMSSEGSKVQMLTEGTYGNFAATWSRDGKSIYYTSRASGRNELWKIPASGGTATQVTRNGSMLGVESPDGKMLYFCKESGAGSIWQMPVTGGEEVKLVDSLWRSNFAVTKQGIYYMTAPRADGTSELMFYSFAEKKSRLVMDMGIAEYGLDVSPDERYLLYAQLDGPASDLMLVENFH